MGLYLCIFDGDDEVDGLEVGSYSDFGALRDYIVRELEGGRPGSRFPTLIIHSDCDGEWSATECDRLHHELEDIANGLKALPPVKFVSDWQIAVAKSVGLIPKNALESFIDVDGQFLILRLQGLAECARKNGFAILFQ